ncbi:hypothetical protein NQ318_011795 [Aromia moschata]|uniref:Acyltransferase n=1 Tax=Aromia moschata TaxID=1265417 RepID=A0AAV8Y4K5_9CUCU|nr:hypothetical protein NQ318_011795 [Aromia moschata]
MILSLLITQRAPSTKGMPAIHLPSRSDRDRLSPYMRNFCIKLAPLNVSFRTRLLSLAALAWIFCIILGGGIGSLFALYVILYTRYWWVMAVYLMWIWVIDRDIAERGGRRSRWVRSWIWWKWLQEYFPLKLVKLPGVELDPKKNYLLCGFPHGMLPTGAFNAFVYEHSGYNTYFPHHIPYGATLAPQFILPFGRELNLSLGGISVSAKSIEYILSRPEGGHACVIVVGGAQEALYCKPSTNKVVLKNRKGFVRLALRHGAPLVPVYSFGETDLYDQLDWPFLRRFQEKLRKWIPISPIVPIGRGIFQDSFGIIPRNRPVTTVECSSLDNTAPQKKNVKIQRVDPPTPPPFLGSLKLNMTIKKIN